MTAGRPLRMTCACCGEYAGQFKQHPNRDTGFGVCAHCIEWLKGRGMSAEEILDLYGTAGINYEAKGANMTRLIIDNINKAIEVLTAAPEESLDLATFKNQCGSTHCAVGWLTTDEHFAKQGLALTREVAYSDSDGRFFLYNKLTHAGAPGYQSDYDWLDKLFGENAFDRLFLERFDGEWDEDILDNDDGISDKELALERLRRQLDVVTA